MRQRREKSEASFSARDVGLAFTIVRSLDPDHYRDDEVKALIYKLRTLDPGEDFWVGPR